MTRTLLRLASLSLLLTLAADAQTRRADSSAEIVKANNAPLTVESDKGALRVRTPRGLALSVTKVRLRFADGASVSSTLESAVRDGGRDAGGDYESLRLRLEPIAALQTGAKKSFDATLELRTYHRDTLVAFLDYDGPALAATDSVQLVTFLDSFARGTATRRLKLYWTAPHFVSDYRLLGPSNHLLLWRRLAGDYYHLLVPLAGGGMTGELGVSEVDFRFEFRVSSASRAEGFTPRRVPLFAYAASADPYRLPRATYETAFAASEQYGRLRWQKGFPEVFSLLGWCSWNAYGNQVSEAKIISSVRSMREKRIPVGFVLVDDGWLSTRDNKLTSYAADKEKFPRGLEGLARALRDEFGVKRLGVWHTFHGYWSGVEPASEAARGHKLFRGLGGNEMPDPQGGAGESFYADWYALLKRWGYDFVKVDGQGNTVKFTDGLLPLFDAGRGAHRNLQSAAAKSFGDSGRGPGPGVGVINCMEMSLENAYNWNVSNVARNSDDYLPDTPQNVKEHVYQNAYNAYWLSNFAYPDWDMFQSHDAHADYHAAARALSGGPIYFTDEAGRERAEVLLPLALSDGRLLTADEPAQVTRDMLMTDPSMEALPLKIFGTVSRQGHAAAVVAAFNVNKSAREVTGALRVGDVAGPQREGATPERHAVYQRSRARAVLLEGRDAPLPFTLGEFGFDLFTLAPVERGAAVFGLLDKYVGPAAVASVRRDANGVTVRLREAGDFGAWLERAPARVELDGRALARSEYSFEGGLLRVPRAAFGARGGERTVSLRLGARRR